MTKDNFKLLSDQEHIRLRFAMYGGSKDVQQTNVFVNGEFKTVPLVGGLLKIINEIIDNSIDEYVRTKGEYAKSISVKIKDGIIEVQDDGRGIPVQLVKTPHGEMYQAEAAFTNARAGSNFDDDTRESIGANGVGSMITFVTSETFEVKSGDGTNTVHFKSNHSNKDKAKLISSDFRGTIVKFKPDYEFFGLKTIDQAHEDMIKARIESLALAFPKISFKFNGKLVRVKFEDFFGGVTKFDNGTSTFGITKSSGVFESFSLVNGLSVKDGQHIETFLDYFIQEFRDVLKRRKKVDITRARLKNHLRVHGIVNGFKALKFDSQTKERVTNSAAECKVALGEFDAKAIVNKLMKNSDLIDEICAYTKLQEDLLAKKDLEKLEKKTKIKSDKYFASVGQTKRIFVVEGDSASGGLIKCLGRKNQAFYALKGVPLNVLEVSHQKFMANKELSELYAIITMYPEAEICIATDQDPDGARIRGLLILFLNQYFPGHFEKSLVRVLNTPLAMGKRKGVPKEWAYNFSEVNNIDSKLELQYMKGLGSWSDKDLKHIISIEGLDKMMKPVVIDDQDLLHKWFRGSESDFRKVELINAPAFDIMRI